jgi:hypothetical protein
MKTTITLLLFPVTALLFNLPADAQCNYASGGDGVSISYVNSITIDGNMSDWTAFLNDPDNNSYDNTSGVDKDAPVSDVGRDLTRFAFTEDADYLYFYLARAGSTSNSTDILFYVDVNNNDFMDFKEPVYHISWSGSNGNAVIEVYDYNPALLSGNQISSTLDGERLMGTLTKRSNSGSGNANDGCAAFGAADGKSIEVKLPFARITQLNILDQVITQLTFGQDFKFHVSTINGSIGSVPGSNSINDNFGACVRAPLTLLPVHLVSFQGNMDKNNKVILNWTIADNETAYSFEVERSLNGLDFTTAGVVFSSEKRGTEKYTFYETVGNYEKVMYRLKMIDKGHDADYSRVLVFRTRSISDNNIKIIGNPVKDKLTFSYSASSTRIVDVKVYDMSGRTVLSNKINSFEGNNTLSLSLNSTFKPGLYVVEVSDASERQSTKFVKQ